ncbi:MAG: relaxase/mobilization nuclease domain-containing protein [Chloroflexota bacterium]|nr:relaxase/mobilization nuclease domain-containing protein [Chloroflexota bacterium]
MAQVIVKTNWTKSAGAAKASIRYIEARPRGAEEPTRELWTKDSTISRADAYALIDAHHRHSVAAHRLILSPSADTPPDDLRRMTREVLGRLEAARGQTLHWVATEHRNTTHPHVHVILAGSGERNDQARAVRLTPRSCVAPSPPPRGARCAAGSRPTLPSVRCVGSPPGFTRNPTRATPIEKPKSSRPLATLFTWCGR